MSAGANSNGSDLWLLRRVCELSGTTTPQPPSEHAYEWADTFGDRPRDATAAEPRLTPRAARTTRYLHFAEI
eukprot:CAMPEP_0119361806 /NCGR_PEP_ID=MMETSP1334-20130426/9042_1 /TAXON_ID=127549 /ORGANISM="Calcidiscus leptoporus, Strain RCC1130" /LENGTH=71 /DNA_ID=CAMNT_0007376915 /DNA_START=257 /DNA_END=472 /DNA_ORIENTATION=+